MSLQSFINFGKLLNSGKVYSKEEIESVFNTNFGARIKGITLRNTLDNDKFIILFSRAAGPYGDNIKGDIFYYEGEGLVGDQELTASNKALIESMVDHRPIYGFRQENANEDWKFIGNLEVIDYKYLFKQKRQVYEFLLKQINDSLQLSSEIKESKPEFIKEFRLTPLFLRENENKEKKTKVHIDFGERNQRNSNTGKKGEAMVLQSEKDYLIKIGKPELAKKVESISTLDDSAGYDILSFDADGNEKYIEVKSTVLPKRKDFSFYISANEKKIAEKTNNYYLYLVFDVNKANPKIVTIKNPFSLGLLLVEPSAYIVRGASE